jgi:hypothetical protein
MTVDVVQPLGDVVYAYLVPGAGREVELSGTMAGDRQLLAAVPPDAGLSPGDVVDVAVDSNDVHVFAATGECLLHGHEVARGRSDDRRRTPAE